MPAFLLPLALTAASALSGYLGQRGKRKQTGTSKTTPTLDPAYEGLQNSLMPLITNRLNNPTGLPAGYESEGVSAINRTFDAGRQGTENDLVARGLDRSPVGASAVQAGNNARLGSIAQFRSGLPMVARDMQNQDLELAMRMLGMGRGTSTTTEEEGDIEGGGGIMDNVGAMLGWLAASGSFAGNPRGMTTVPSGLRQLGNMNLGRIGQ